MMAFLVACTEDIVIDVEEGDPMIGVDVSFTDEMKHHEAILSYTAEFYNQNEIHMISGATVYVTDGVDTVYYYEDAEQEGHYFTELVAGTKNTLYRLCVEVPEPDGSVQTLFSESLIPDNVESIDSLVIKHFNGGNDTIPTVFMKDTIEWLYPYFQSLPDPSIVYMIKVTEDTIPQNDTLLKVNTIPMAGYAGYYVNGPEMLEKNMEIPVAMVTESQLYDGKLFRLDLLSIPYDYMMFVFNVKMAMGSNPMMGPPTNVMTNIQPQGEAVGFFYAASVVSKEMIYHTE